MNNDKRPGAIPNIPATSHFVSHIGHVPQIEEKERIYIAECNAIPDVLDKHVKEVAREVKKAQLYATRDKQKSIYLDQSPETFLEYADWLIRKAKM